MVSPVSIQMPRIEPQLSSTSKIKEFVSFKLMKRDSFDGIDKNMLKNILISCSPDLLKEFKKEIQGALDEIDLTSVTQQNRLLIHHLISLIPYSFPSVNDSFVLPVKNEDGKYERQTFSVDQKIQLKLIFDSNTLDAYSLKSSNDDNLLLFTGTTFPGAGGFLNSLAADFTPFTSVGKGFIIANKEKLNEYFSCHQNVEVYGTSLGGALALHMLNHYESKIKHTTAIVPPGLHISDKFDIKSEAKVLIVIQSKDVVSKLGFFPEGKNVEIYKLKVKAPKTTGMHAHIRVFAGSKNLEINQLDPSKENKTISRKIVTASHFLFGWIIFLAIMVAYIVKKVFDLTYSTIAVNPKPAQKIEATEQAIA